MNFKKISALACTMTILGGMATATPVFAAPQDTKTSNVPVTGKVGLWQDGNTDPSNPDKPGSGGQGEDNEINKPDEVTDINVTVPASMTFNVVTNTKDGNPVFASGAYNVTNNGSTKLTMQGEFTGGNSGEIQLVDKASVTPAKDGVIKLAISLNEADGKDASSVTTPFIEEVKNGARSNEIDLNATSSKTLKFASTQQGMTDVAKEASDGGALVNTTKSTQGTLTLTFAKAN
ncbi:hypothetical protein ACSXD3_16690 (plasmid) [Clostridium perfringens]